MAERLISADNHIDMTYCPPDLWTDAAPREWKTRVPRTEEREDGLHWVVDGVDKGMWNGVGPGFGKYEKGSFTHVDEMADLGFVWDYRRGAGSPGGNPFQPARRVPARPGTNDSSANRAPGEDRATGAVAPPWSCRYRKVP